MCDLFPLSVRIGGNLEPCTETRPWECRPTHQLSIDVIVLLPACFNTPHASWDRMGAMRLDMQHDEGMICRTAGTRSLRKIRSEAR